MDPIAEGLLALGVLLLVGLAADLIGGRVAVPRVTMLLALGYVVGPDALDLLPPITDDWFPVGSPIALSMVGFLLGAEARFDRLRLQGGPTLVLATFQGLVTAAVVSLGLLAVGADLVVALPLGGIAVATAPAATIAVVEERSTGGPFTRMLLSVVALDDVLALTLFSILATVATYVSGADGGLSLVGEALWEILGAVGLGLVLGFPAAALTGRLRPGRPTQEEAYGLVLVIAGMSLWLGVSFLLAAIVLGATIANRAEHHETPFREIERIEWPALVVFFVLAGAALELSSIGEVGVIGVAYIGLRVAGKLSGCVVGARLTEQPPATGRWLGAAMLPQAGVAIGLTLLAVERFPEVADELLPVVIAATMLFELVGPFGTSVALQRMGETES